MNLLLNFIKQIDTRMVVIDSFVVENGQSKSWAHFSELESQQRDKTTAKIQPEGLEPLIVGRDGII